MRILFSTRHISLCYNEIAWGERREHPWLPFGDDQRASWCAMLNTYGRKFSMTWIRGQGENRGDEYFELTKYASTLYLDGIWLFNSGPVDSELLEEFCHAAWLNGWLRRVPDSTAKH